MRPFGAHQVHWLAVRSVVAAVALTTSLSLPITLLSRPDSSIGVAYANQVCPFRVPDTARLPEIAAKIQANLEGAGLVGTRADVIVAHEQCVGRKNGQIIVENEPGQVRVSVPIENVNDSDTIATLARVVIASALPVVMTESASPLSGLESATLEISYTGADTARCTYETELSRIQEIHDQELTGATLRQAFPRMGCVL